MNPFTEFRQSIREQLAHGDCTVEQVCQIYREELDENTEFNEPFRRAVRQIIRQVESELKAERDK